ncbi:MAG: efflux RND transporter periplasmic adaptor subunit [Planctomycetia bacterium]|nr:efflux RND transporter periplasmic adaptor subunit [Planctomycetia bacterium]
MARIIPLFLFAAALTGSCDSSHKAPPPSREPPVVSIAKPLQIDYQPYADFTGRLAAVEEVEVRPRVGGFLEKVNFQVGSDVGAGDVLFVIDARPFQAEVDRAAAEVSRAESAFKQSEIEYKRIEDLYQKESATQIEFDRLMAARDMAKAELAAANAALARAQLDLEWTRVTAPISGRVSRNFVDAGNLVQGGVGIGTLLTRIVTMDPIFVYLDVDEQTMLRCQRKIREGKMETYREGIVPVSLELANEQGYPHEGGVDFVDNRVDADTGTLRIRGRFDNPKRILGPGMFARVRLFIGELQRSLSVSERAIGFDQGERFLLVVNAKNEVEYRRIKIGGLEEDMRIIMEGVAPDDWVIVNGLQRVRPGVKVTPQKVNMRTFAPVESPSAPDPAKAASPAITSQPVSENN